MARPYPRTAREEGRPAGRRTDQDSGRDIATLQTLARRDDLAVLTSSYGLVVVDECHHVPAAAFEHAVRQIPARRWLGLTATPYRRDQLDDLIGLQLGPVRQTMVQLPSGTMSTRSPQASPPEPVLYVHPTSFQYSGGASPRHRVVSPPFIASSLMTASAPSRWLTTSRSRWALDATASSSPNGPSTSNYSPPR
jgi:hypothetical protein